jgi:glycerophosphoryl diester phosphodiesterase
MPPDRTARYHALPSPLLIGHRGLGTVAPENTLEAIEEAARVGAGGVEIDVRPCRDGELVVFHDRDLKRMTGQPERVESLDWSELKRVDLGGATIPRLADVVSLCERLDLFLNIELKRDVPSRRQLVRSVAHYVRRLGPEPVIALSSFDPAMLAQLRRDAPGVPRAVLYASRHRWVRRLAAPLAAVAVHPDHRLVRALDVRRAHAAGRRVMCWTVNDVGDAKRLLALGVDGVMTDDPAALFPLFEQG